MGIYVTMANDSPDAHVLLQVAPEQYVTERTRLVKQARAGGDKATAAAYQALKRPSVALWAALAAGEGDAVHQIMKVTTDLGEVQAGGSDPGSLAAATQRRRKVLDTFVADAVKALAKLDSGAEKRRQEIRALVDQLSRHPELAETWIDGTLRDLPDDEFGFGAFAGMDVSPATAPRPTPSTKATKATATTAKPSRRAEPEPDEPTRDLAAERAARAARADESRQARTAVAEAARQVAAADKQVVAARAVVRDAAKQLALAERAQATATQRHERAVAHHESLR
jgi:hypothetical protein